MVKFTPKKQDKEAISIRLPVKLLETVDRTAAKVDISRNELINQCIEFALENLELPQ
jgi:hypothetical protein